MSAEKKIRHLFASVLNKKSRSNFSSDSAGRASTKNHLISFEIEEYLSEREREKNSFIEFRHIAVSCCLCVMGSKAVELILK